jgi:hypothetical protein
VAEDRVAVGEVEGGEDVDDEERDGDGGGARLGGGGGRLGGGGWGGGGGAPPGRWQPASVRFLLFAGTPSTFSGPDRLVTIGVGCQEIRDISGESQWPISIRRPRV